MNFRKLNSNEIEVRVATVSEKGVSLLLYKDARVDQRILDETVGAMNWQRHHTRDNANCIVAIWDEDKKQWIEKEDTGTESFTEKEKGLASDSFKRACFNWGIGRELYTAPFIWVSDANVKQVNGKWKCYDNFKVKSIEYADEEISALEIVNEKTNKVVFGTRAKAKPNVNPMTREQKEDLLVQLCDKRGKKTSALCAWAGVTEFAELTDAKLDEAIGMLNK